MSERNEFSTLEEWFKEWYGDMYQDYVEGEPLWTRLSVDFTIINGEVNMDNYDLQVIRHETPMVWPFTHPQPSAWIGENQLKMQMRKLEKQMTDAFRVRVSHGLDEFGDSRFTKSPGLVIRPPIPGRYERRNIFRRAWEWWKAL